MLVNCKTIRHIRECFWYDTMPLRVEVPFEPWPEVQMQKFLSEVVSS